MVYKYFMSTFTEWVAIKESFQLAELDPTIQSKADRLIHTYYGLTAAGTASSVVQSDRPDAKTIISWFKGLTGSRNDPVVFKKAMDQTAMTHHTRYKDIAIDQRLEHDATQLAWAIMNYLEKVQQSRNYEIVRSKIAQLHDALKNYMMYHMHTGDFTFF